jgi:hypothetical protein
MRDRRTATELIDVVGLILSRLIHDRKSSPRRS